MAKKTETVKVKKGSLERSFPKAQWDEMVKNKETYGWIKASDLPKGVTEKEKQIELSEINSLKQKNKELEEEVARLKSAQFKAPDASKAKSSNLEGVGSSEDSGKDPLSGTVAEFEAEVSKIDDTGALEALKASEEAKAGRKGIIKAIEERIEELNK